MLPTKYLSVFVSEFLCTGLLVGLTCLSHYAMKDSQMLMSITYGLLNMLLTKIFSPFSGGYANPAVVLALWWRERFPRTKFLTYIAAELTGAAAGHYTIHKWLNISVAGGMCTFNPKTPMSDINIVIAEFLLTFLLVMTWCVLWEYEAEFGMEWYLGGVNALVYLLGVNLTGGCTNPARSIAPLVFLKSMNTMGKFCITGQLLAGVTAPILWASLERWSKS